MTLAVVRSKFDFERSLDCFDTFDFLDCWTNSTVAAKDFLLFVSYNCRQWHVLKGFIDFGEDTIRVVDVLSESLGAFVSESEVLIHILVFVVSSEKHNLTRILQLQSEKQAHNLKVEAALVDIVSKEHVIIGMNISSVTRSLPNVEESHKICILAVKITENLGRRANFLYYNRLCCKYLAAFISELDDVLSLAREFSSWLQILSFFWLEKWLHEHLAKRVIWIFVDLLVIF